MFIGDRPGCRESHGGLASEIAQAPIDLLEDVVVRAECPVKKLLVGCVGQVSAARAIAKLGQTASG
jgi:hypothetical protein